MTENMTDLDRAAEPVLDDCHLIFEDFIYLIDGQPRRSPITGTVRGLKRKLWANEVRRCDVIARGLHNRPVPYTHLER
jgi:hypothetical protein